MCDLNSGIAVFRVLTLACIPALLSACISYQTVPKQKIDEDIVLATASLASYELIDIAKREAILNSALLEEEYVFVDGSSEFIVASKGPEAVLAFTGTNKESSSQDWDENFDCSLVEFESEKLEVSKGYQRSWLSVRTEVLGALESLGNDVPVLITGHSKGGATAVIAGYDLILQGYNVKKVVTFGAPPAHEAFYGAALGTPNKQQKIIAERKDLSELERVSTHYVSSDDVVPEGAAYFCNFSTLERRDWNLGARFEINWDRAYLESKHYGYSDLNFNLGDKKRSLSIDPQFDYPDLEYTGHSMAKYLHLLRSARYLEYQEY